MKVQESAVKLGFKLEPGLVLIGRGGDNFVVETVSDKTASLCYFSGQHDDDIEKAARERLRQGRGSRVHFANFPCNYVPFTYERKREVSELVAQLKERNDVKHGAISEFIMEYDKNDLETIALKSRLDEIFGKEVQE